MSLIDELSSALTMNWTFRQSGNIVQVYYDGKIMCRLTEMPVIERLESCTRFLHQNIREAVRLDLVSAVICGLSIDSSWFKKYSLNTYERNAALRVADSKVICDTIVATLGQVSHISCPTTYDEVLVHVLSRRAAELLMQGFKGARCETLRIAEREIIEERVKQTLRYSESNDDGYDKAELARVAACLATGSRYLSNNDGKDLWPKDWDDGLFTNNHRTNCVKAAALLIAEIERLDRAALRREAQ